MIQLKKFKFNNIRCFDTEQLVDLSSHGKLIQVDGLNKNTGGSSGAGKTTIFLALDYLLGISDVPSTILQSRLTKDLIYVEGDFNIDGKEVTIKRSKKDGLTIVKPSETISGNVKLAEEELDRLIGIPRDVFKKMVHKRQKEGGFFLDMTAKKTYEFLIQVLGLDIYIEKTDKISEDIKQCTQKLSDLQSKIEAYESQSKQLSGLLESKVKPTCDVKKEEVEALEKLVESRENELNKLKDSLEHDRNKFKKPEKIEIQQDAGKLKSIQDQLSSTNEKLNKISKAHRDLENKINLIPNIKNEAQRIGLEVSKLKDQREHISKAECPTCRQKWVGDSAQGKIKALDGEIENLISKALELKTEIDKEPEYVTNLERLGNIYLETKEQIAHLQQQESEEFSRLQSEEKEIENKNLKLEAEYREQISKIEQTYEPKIRETNEILSKIKPDLAEKKSTLNQFNQRLKEYTGEIDKLKNMIRLEKEKHDNAVKEVGSLQNRIAVAEESKRLIKSYILQTFQETLDLIGNMATDILSGVPNMANATIYFDGCKETKSGALKDEVTAIVNVDGTNAIPIKSLSGGERTTIDLAVDLAVIDVIEAKAGKGVDFFVIDEPFDGLDSVCKENYLEILTKIDTNKKIIMVDHSSELKEMVSNVIYSVKDGESSSIVT